MQPSCLDNLDLIAFSAGNYYNDNKNIVVSKCTQKVQGYLQSTQGALDNKKDQMVKIVDMMKRSKNMYVQTLLDGEQNNHCKGIQKRFIDAKFYHRQSHVPQEEEDIEIKRL